MSVNLTGVPEHITYEQMGAALKALGLPDTTESLSADARWVSASIITDDGREVGVRIPVYSPRITGVSS